MGELQLIRTEILRSCACCCSSATAHASPRVLQQTARHQCWAASSSLAESCQELWADVKFAQLQSQDKVFARQVPELSNLNDMYCILLPMSTRARYS